ncbi:MAG: acyltransferase family protein [bacterium]
MEFDFLRALAICYIIGVRHLDDYASQFFLSKLDTTLAYIFLGLFVYISGFLLLKNNSYLIDSKQKIWVFFKKRFFRIYPLYIFALLLFLVNHFMDFRSFIYHIFLLNLFLNKSVLTLWFISLICFYYFLFPIFVYKYNKLKIVLLSLFICLGLFIINLISGLIDIRLIIYLPLFIFGIITAKNNEVLDILKKKINIFIFFIVCIFSACLYFYNNNFQYLFIMIFMLSSVPPLLFLGEEFIKKVKYYKIIINLSYASYCMYLFHRVVFYLLLKIYHPKTDIFILVYLGFIGLPLIYLLAKKAQSAYDLVFLRLVNV